MQHNSFQKDSPFKGGALLHLNAGGCSLPMGPSGHMGGGGSSSRAPKVQFSAFGLRPAPYADLQGHPVSPSWNLGLRMNSGESQPHPLGRVGQHCFLEHLIFFGWFLSSDSGDRAPNTSQRKYRSPVSAKPVSERFLMSFSAFFSTSLCPRGLFSTLNSEQFFAPLCLHPFKNTCRHFSHPA